MMLLRPRQTKTSGEESSTGVSPAFVKGECSRKTVTIGCMILTIRMTRFICAHSPVVTCRTRLICTHLVRDDLYDPVICTDI